MKKRIGSYYIERLLGHGHSAAVYLGKKRGMQESVAIKLLHMFAPEKEVQAAFKQEVEVIQRLHHPSIIEILEVGFDEMTPYFTMRYAIGGSLRERHPSGSCLFRGQPIRS